MITKIRSQWQNRNYHSNYDNRVRKFFIELANGGMLKDVAEKLEITYGAMHSAFKLERISYSMYNKILSRYSLTDNQKDELLDLLKGLK